MKNPSDANHFLLASFWHAAACTPAKPAYYDKTRQRSSERARICHKAAPMRAATSACVKSPG